MLCRIFLFFVAEFFKHGNRIENNVYVLEVNPRSSRTVPFLSKITGVPMSQIATKCVLVRTAVKNKSLLKSLLKPFLLGKALFAGHGTTDVFLVDVFFCDSDILHRSVPLYPYAFSGTATFLFLAAAYRIRPSPPIKAVISSR